MLDNEKTKEQLIAELAAARARISEFESRNKYTAENSPINVGSAVSFSFEHDALLRSLVEMIPDLVWFKNADGVYLSCNPTFERFFGAKAADIIGKTDYDFVGKNLADSFREYDRKAIEAGKPITNEELLTFADNGYRGLFETIKTPMRDPDGKITGVLGIARDVTERKRAFDALAKVTDELTTVFDNVPASIWYKDTKNNFVRVNKSAAKLTGREVDEINGHSTEEIFPDEAAKYYTDDLEVINSGQPKLGIIEKATAKDGSLRWVSTDKLPVKDQNENVVGVLAFAIDITYRKNVEEMLAESNRTLIDILDGIPASVNVIDISTREILFTNPAQQEALERDVLGLLCHQAFCNRDSPCENCNLDRFAGFTGNSSDILVWDEQDPVTGKWLLHHDHVLRWLSGRMVRVQISLDITTRKLTEEALRELEANHRALIEFAPIGIFQSTPQGRYLTANTRLAEMYGYNSVQDLMDSVQDINVVYVDPGERENILRSVEQGVVNMLEVRRRRKNGSVIWVALSMRAVRDQTGKILHYEGFTHDITERKQMEDKLKELATQDCLTGLNNRRHALELGRALFDIAKRYGSNLTVAMFDIDHFKSVNDNRGHAAGDVVLKNLGEMVLATFRSADVLGRLGGEEFVAIMPETGYSEAMNALERFRQAIETTVIPYEETPLAITISCGVTFLAPADTTLEGLLKKADEALYKAKRDGRNRVVAFVDPPIVAS